MAVIAFLTGNKWGRYLALALLIVALITTAILQIYSKGKKAEKLKALQSKIKNLEVGIKTNEMVNNMPANERLDRLHKHWTRD